MTYCKMVIDNKVVNIGHVFLKWNSDRHKMYICDVDEGQFVQSRDEAHIYHDKWLKIAPAEAGEQEEANIIVITEQEYMDLLELLNSDEEVLNEIIEQEYPEPELEQPQEETPMTIAEMREKILEQEKQIELLLGKL